MTAAALTICAEAVTMIDNMVRHGDETDTLDDRRSIGEMAKRAGRLHMVGSPEPEDHKDTCIVLLVEMIGGPMVRTPLRRSEAVSLLKLIGDALF